MGTGVNQLMSAGGLASTGSLGTNSKIGLGLDRWSAYSNYMSSRRQAEAQADQIIAQAKGAIKTMNYSLSNFENERRNAFEASVAQLGAIRLQARGLEASVQASTGEYQNGKYALRKPMGSARQLKSKTTISVRVMRLIKTKNEHISALGNICRTLRHHVSLHS